MRRPTAAAWVLATLLLWPALHVLAYMAGTTIDRVLSAAAYAAGFGIGAVVLFGLLFAILRR